jgi:hypothetical protein
VATTVGRIDRQSTLGEELAEAQAALASHGIKPGPDGAYDEATLRDAIHARGWTYRLEAGDEGWWGAEVRQDLSTMRAIFAGDGGPSKETALLLALDVMLAADPDEANAQIDADIEDLYGTAPTAEMRR